MSVCVLSIYSHTCLNNHPFWTLWQETADAEMKLLKISPAKPGASQNKASHKCKTEQGRKLAWFGHVTRHDSFSKTILLGTLDGW